MSPDLSDAEQRLLETARDRIREHAGKRREQGLHDVLYAFVLSDTGSVYTGIPFESSQPAFNFCAERAAINRMRLEEPTADLAAVLVAGPVPDDDRQVTLPCGACRHAIHESGGPDTPVIATCFVRQEDGWELFPVIEHRTATELYPDAYAPPDWD